MICFKKTAIVRFCELNCLLTNLLDWFYNFLVSPNLNDLDERVGGIPRMENIVSVYTYYRNS